MDFNVKKSKILFFNSKGKLPHYSLHGHELEIVEEVKYLDVIIQSDMKFTAHIQRKHMTANQQLCIIKTALYWAPTSAELLAYKTLCLHHLEYAAGAWTPKQQERYIRHRTTPRPSSAIYSWYQGEGWCRRCQD